MSKNIRKTHTVDAGKNLAWEIRYALQPKEEDGGTCLHCNYAEGVGQALFAFHQWIQHNMATPLDEYQILSVHRLLRQEHDGNYQVTGKVLIEDCPLSNPVTPKPGPVAVEDHTHPFDFLAEVPVVSTLRK